jgi:2-polyprenyl-3-methyl-5-hydroxy-6-metoxy-1,4-benzoquinol methylase
MESAVLKDVWAGKYFGAAMVFLLTQAVLLLIVIAVWTTQVHEDGLGMTVYMLGVSGILIGGYLVVSAGLLAARRWGAILATLWAVGIVSANTLYFVLGDPIGDETGIEAAATAAGAGCGGLLNLLVLIFAARALLAKRPPEDPPILSLERGDVLHPYGQLALKPQRMGWQVKLLLVIGIALAGGGALAAAAGVLMQWKAAVVDESAWQRYEFPESGFAIEFPAAPETTEDFIESRSIIFSRQHRVLLPSVLLDAVHYRGQAVVQPLEELLLPLAPDLIPALHRGADVADIGCSLGQAVLKMARLYPQSRFTGFDLSEDAIRGAQLAAEAGGVANARFVQRDCTNLAEERAFDVVFTFDAVHDQGRPDLMLQGIRKALKPGGLYFMLDIKASSDMHKNSAHMLGTFLYSVSCMHCMSVSLAQGGMGLGAVWGIEKAQEMLADAGFGSVEVRELEHDPFNVVFLCRE